MLNNLTIPTSVTSISNMAFKDCIGLTELIAEAETPVDLSITYQVFDRVDQANCKLYVPSFNAQSAYYSADKWRSFNIIVGLPTAINTTGLDDVKIYVSNGDIIIEGITTTSEVSIFDLTGRLITKNQVRSGTNTIRATTKGALLVKVDNTVKKILIN